MHESGVVEDMSLTSMMMENIERTLVRLERRRMKTLYFTFEKDKFKSRVEKNANKEGKNIYVEYDRRDCEDTQF